MKYRLTEFFSRKSYTSDATEVIDLKIQDPISSIVVGLEVNYACEGITAHPVATITKLQLVDGSDVLYSLDGYEADALDWYNNKGRFRYNRNYYLNGNDFRRYIGINFGRYLWDKEYALDPKRFTNPQLRISLNIDAAAATVATVYLTCWANIFDEATVSLRGFLMSKEVKQYAIASAVHEYTELPLDHVYRGLYIRPFVAGTMPSEVITNIKLSEDQDKKVPIDHSLEKILRNMQGDLLHVEERYNIPGLTALSYAYVAPAERVSAVGSSWRETSVAMDPAFYGGGGGKLSYICGVQGPNLQFHVRGYLPHAVLEIPFGDRNDPADWYDVRRLGSLKLDITGGATATGYIFLQQERPY